MGAMNERAIDISQTLTFEEVSQATRARSARWHNPEVSDPWTGADWSNAMCGEAGETANVVKKLRRLATFHDGKTPDGTAIELLAKLAEEMADTYLYLDLLADHYGIDLPLAIVEKFNRKSIEQGFPERLPASPIPTGEPF